MDAAFVDPADENRARGSTTPAPEGDYDIVCVSHLRWGFVYQRPQHLLSRFARNHRVFYVEEPQIGGDETSVRFEEVAQNVLAVVAHLPDGTTPEDANATQAGVLEDLIVRHGIERYVLWIYTPMATAFTRGLRPIATVYDCMDELSAFAGAPAELLDREGELLDSADLVFTGGRSLYESKRSRHPHVHLFPSSVEKAHFARARMPGPDPDDQRGIPRPRIGFFGVIDERLDAALLDGVARLRPDWHFVLIGPVLKIDEATLPRRANVHYLGHRRYEQLPDYIRGWDAAILPFARNRSTRFISPTKTPEYLAAGRPVVSTSIRDVVRPYGELGVVRIADEPEAFAAALDAALAEDAGTRTAAADEFLTDMSWDATWERMASTLDTAIARHGDAATALPPPVVDLGAGARVQPIRSFDALVVGAGFAGSVVAERLATAGRRVLLVERRNHVGGNAYDHYDEHGVLVHRYGPHIFHTNSAEVFDYLSRFTAWRPYQHRVLASVDGQLVPVPINLDTINRLYGLQLSAFDLERFFAERAEPIEHPRTSEDVVVSKVGRELYEKFFRGYTRKQWGLDPSELDASVTARVPVRTNRDDRYFTDTYQAMPLHGYTATFERMLDHPNIKVLLNTDYREVATIMPFEELVFTGPIDEFFDFRFGRLPYRSLEFRFETRDVDRHQPAPVVNYPSDYAFTRVTEFKYLTGQEHARTTLVYEYPRAEGDPYYPVPRPENAVLYKRYKALAHATPGVHFVGRLATYKYYNIDQVVAQALAVSRRLVAGAGSAEGGDVLGDAVSSAAPALGRGRMHA